MYKEIEKLFAEVRKYGTNGKIAGRVSTFTNRKSVNSNFSEELSEDASSYSEFNAKDSSYKNVSKNKQAQTK